MNIKLDENKVSFNMQYETLIFKVDKSKLFEALVHL